MRSSSRPGGRWGRQAPARLVLAVAAAVALVGAGCSSDREPAGSATPATAGGIEAGYPADQTMRLNQVQLLGSHNSYHRAPPREFADRLNALIPGLTRAWEYSHPPLTEQLSDQGVRQVELDVYTDPSGGRYARRAAYAFAGLDAQAPPEMSQAGLKVFHLPELDVQTTCLTFRICLDEIKAWSDAHPGHAPIMVLVEAKDQVIPDPLKMGFVTPLPIDAAALDEIDATVRTVFAPGDLITPDDVRGSAATLEQAVLTQGWPTLGASRGKVLFALDNGDLRQTYAQGHPSLAGRVMFTSAEPGEAEAAFIKRNDAVADRDEITSLVRRGYLVRTRSDSDTAEARTNDHTVADAALASGAQYVSTDYEVPDPALGPFQVAIPGGTPGRCNPVNAPPGCTPTDVENPDHLRAGS